MPSAATTTSACASAIGELDAGQRAVLLEADRAVADVHDPGGQVGGEEIDEVGAVHAEGGVPARPSDTWTGAIGVRR
jgi:hypothetical protein